MYTKQEASKQRQAFWTTFGQYMQPVLPAEGQKVNWVNYKTGISGINFKMDADSHNASIAIILSHADTAVRQEHYEQLLQLQPILQEQLGEDWLWQQEIETAYEKIISSVSKEINDLNINKNEDWPALISFFKPRIMALDAFWAISKNCFWI